MKNYKERYLNIVKSDFFNKAYNNKSIGITETETELKEIWVIRLKKDGQKYLISFKPRALKWGHFKNALSFSSKYKAKQVYNQIKDMAACELYKYI
jgi:hypothetical protein